MFKKLSKSIYTNMSQKKSSKKQLGGERRLLKEEEIPEETINTRLYISKKSPYYEACPSQAPELCGKNTNFKGNMRDFGNDSNWTSRFGAPLNIQGGDNNYLWRYTQILPLETPCNAKGESPAIPTI